MGGGSYYIYIQFISLTITKARWSWKVTVGHHKLSQVVALIEAVFQDVVSLLKQIDMASGIWYVATDLEEMFSSPTPIHVRKEDQKRWQSLGVDNRGQVQSCPMPMLSQILWQNIVQGQLGHLDIQSITPICSIDDNILTDQIAKKWQAYQSVHNLSGRRILVTFVVADKTN